MNASEPLVFKSLLFGETRLNLLWYLLKKYKLLIYLLFLNFTLKITRCFKSYNKNIVFKIIINLLKIMSNAQVPIKNEIEFNKLFIFAYAITASLSALTYGYIVWSKSPAGFF